MTILRERIQTGLPLEEAFAFVADFANAQRWDPGVAFSERTDGGRIGQDDVGVGTRYRLGVRFAGRTAPMDYVVVTWDPPRRVVLHGAGSGVDAVDDIRFVATSAGTDIDYRASIELRGLMRLVEPFAGSALASIARGARLGMQQALDQRALDRLAANAPAPGSGR